MRTACNMNSKQVIAAISVLALLVILTYPALATGSVSIVLKSNRIANADHVYITVNAVWVHRARQEAGQGWELLSNTSRRFDLISLVNASEVIKGTAPVGSYDSLRFDISNATWIFNGTTNNMQLESGQLISSIDFSCRSSGEQALTVVVNARTETLQGQKLFAATLNATLSNVS
jgi:hypothetical protein